MAPIDFSCFGDSCRLVLPTSQIVVKTKTFFCFSTAIEERKLMTKPFLSENARKDAQVRCERQLRTQTVKTEVNKAVHTVPVQVDWMRKKLSLSHVTWGYVKGIRLDLPDSRAHL